MKHVIYGGADPPPIVHESGLYLLRAAHIPHAALVIQYGVPYRKLCCLIRRAVAVSYHVHSEYAFLRPEQQHRH